MHHRLTLLALLALISSPQLFNPAEAKYSKLTNLQTLSTALTHPHYALSVSSTQNWCARCALCLTVDTQHHIDTITFATGAALESTGNPFPNTTNFHPSLGPPQPPPSPPTLLSLMAPVNPFSRSRVGGGGEER